MKNPSTVLAVAAVALLTALAGCAGSVRPADLTVASYPAAFLAESLAGDDLVVADLAAAGELHDFEPSARDLDQLRQSTYLLLWDEELEAWAHRAQTSLGGSAPTVLEVARMPAGEHFIEEGDEEGGEDGADGDHGDDHGDDHAHGARDPHSWNDPLAMRASLAALEEFLAGAYPEHADAVHARADALRERLDALHADFQAGLSDCARDTIVTNHEAHNYLARRYDFTLFALHGLEPGSEPSPATVDEAIRTIKELGLPVVFIEEGADPAALRAIQQETGVQVEVLATSETRPATGDYLDAQHRNLEQLRTALGCQ